MSTTIRCRTTKKGVKRYTAVIRVKGYKPAYCTFGKKTQAVDWADIIEGQMKNGTYVEPDLNSNISDGLNKLVYMSELIEDFKINEAPARYGKYAKKYNCMYDWWIKEIGDVKIEEFKAPHIAACKQKLLVEETKETGKPRKPNTIIKYLMCLSVVLTHAANELEIIEYNPKRKVKNPKKPAGRKRFLSEQELLKFLTICKEHSDMIYIFVLIALATGGRYSEVQTLKVENIDFENLRVYYIDTKNGESRYVYLREDIMELLKNYLIQNDIDSGYIFKGKRNGCLSFIRGTVYGLIREAGIKDFTVHDMRHTFGSYMAMSGASLLDIAVALGHKTIEMSKRYSHLTQKHIDGVVENCTQKMLPVI